MTVRSKLVLFLFLIVQFVELGNFTTNPCRYINTTKEGEQRIVLILHRTIGMQYFTLQCEEYIKTQSGLVSFGIYGYKHVTGTKIESYVKDKLNLQDLNISRTDLNHFDMAVLVGTPVANLNLDENELLTAITGDVPVRLRTLSAKNCPKLNNVSGVFGHKSILNVDFRHTAVKEDCTTLRTYLPSLKICNGVNLNDIHDNTVSNSTQISETATDMPPKVVETNLDTGGIYIMEMVIAGSVILVVILLLVVVWFIITIVKKETPIQWLLNKREGRQQLSTEEPNNP